MTEENKGFKNCFLCLKNKKINTFNLETKLIDEFGGAGYYFDKISYVGYDKSEVITAAIKDACLNFENVLIVCPKDMEEALSGYAGKLLGTQFDNFGFLHMDKTDVFMYFSDMDTVAKPSDFIKILDKKYESKFEKSFIKTVGAPEEVISSALGKAKKICAGLSFNVKDKFGDCSIEIVYESSTPKAVYDGAIRTLVSELKDYIYALEDITLEERLFQLLKLRRMKISTAESFTGGGVSKRLVSVSGVSEVFFEGLNTYSNESKAERLGVETETLRRYGAVSKETAYEMAAGLIAGGNCDVAVATTGIAGPKSDNTLKPVGLLYIAIGKKDGVSVYEYNLKGSRENITERAINLALFLAYKSVK